MIYGETSLTCTTCGGSGGSPAIPKVWLGSLHGWVPQWGGMGRYGWVLQWGGMAGFLNGEVWLGSSMGRYGWNGEVWLGFLIGRNVNQLEEPGSQARFMAFCRDGNMSSW